MDSCFIVVWLMVKDVAEYPVGVNDEI